MGSNKTFASTRSTALVSVFADEAASAPLARAIRVASVLFVASLTAAAAQISIPLPFTPVPLTLQPMIVLLGAAALGSRLGFASQMLYLAAGIAGLPVFAASAALPVGIGRLLGPTGGFLLSYPFAAWITGRLAERGFDRRYATSVAAMVAGLAVIFAGGVSMLTLQFAPALGRGALSAAFAAGCSPFIAADLVKLLFAATILPGVWKLVGR